MTARGPLDQLRARYPGARSWSSQLNGPDLVDGRPVGSLVGRAAAVPDSPQPPEVDQLLVVAGGWRTPGLP